MTWLKSIEAVLKLAGDRARMIAHGSKPWRSATFAGTKELVTLSFEGAEAKLIGEAFLAEVTEHEFTIPGHLVMGVEMIWTHRSADRLDTQIEMTLLEKAPA